MARWTARSLHWHIEMDNTSPHPPTTAIKRNQWEDDRATCQWRAQLKTTYLYDKNHMWNSHLETGKHTCSISSPHKFSPDSDLMSRSSPHSRAWFYIWGTVMMSMLAAATGGGQSHGALNGIMVIGSKQSHAHGLLSSYWSLWLKVTREVSVISVDTLKVDLTYRDPTDCQCPDKAGVCSSLCFQI